MSSHSQAWSLVKDFHQPRPTIFWADLLLSAAAGWAGFTVALFSKPFSAVMWSGFLIATVALYRALCFVHEISHMRRSQLRGFETTWNALIGVPLLMPSFVYVGVHSNHHSLATYGTNQDPEYLPFASSHWMTVLFAAHSVLIPVALLFRFLVLAPAGLVWPALHRWLVVHASSLSMNTRYRREVSPALTACIRRWEIAILLVWLAAGITAVHYHRGWRLLAAWSGVSACAALANALRTLGAHRYESTGTPLDRDGQLTDSIDTPGALWTGLWAPVGLRYHALHHYFPGIPYHNLGSAYRRLVRELPGESRYRELTSPSLPRSLHRLYAAGQASLQKERAAKICTDASVRSSGN